MRCFIIETNELFATYYLSTTLATTAVLRPKRNETKRINSFPRFYYILYILNLDRLNHKIIDIGELDGGKVAIVTFPKVNDLTNFNVVITPDTGYWKGATYKFVFAVPPHYPHSPPKVECKTKIYHPNIDLQGKVCLNILREDWRPVLDINSVIYGLIYLFYEPNPDDPLNHEAAELFRRDIRRFELLVNRTLRGGPIDGNTYERLVK